MLNWCRCEKGCIQNEKMQVAILLFSERPSYKFFNPRPRSFLLGNDSILTIPSNHQTKILTWYGLNPLYQWHSDLYNALHQSSSYSLKFVHDNSVLFHIPSSMRISNESNCHFVTERFSPIWCRTVQNVLKSLKRQLAETHKWWPSF